MRWFPALEMETEMVLSVSVEHKLQSLGTRTVH